MTSLHEPCSVDLRKKHYARLADGHAKIQGQRENTSGFGHTNAPFAAATEHKTSSLFIYGRGPAIMTSRSTTLLVLAILLSSLGSIAAACQAHYTLDGAPEPVTTYESGGAAVTVRVNSAPPGQAVAFAAIPSSISVSPATVTADTSGNAEAYALVPYGIEGIVVVSSAFSTPKNIAVQAPPLTLCTPTVSVNDGGVIGSVGQVYAVSVQVMTSSAASCAAPNSSAAPAGIPITITTLQPSSPATSSGGSSGDAGGAITPSSSPAATVLTDANGMATTNIQLPWGANVLIQATGGGVVTFTSQASLSNPVTIKCVTWTPQHQAGIYQLTAEVVAGVQPIPAAPIGLSVIYPSASAATIVPPVPITNEAGAATAFVVVPDAGSLPVVVEAVLGSTAYVSSSDGTLGTACP